MENENKNLKKELKLKKAMAFAIAGFAFVTVALAGVAFTACENDDGKTNLNQQQEQDQQLTDEERLEQLAEQISSLEAQLEEVKRLQEEAMANDDIYAENEYYMQRQELNHKLAELYNQYNNLLESMKENEENSNVGDGYAFVVDDAERE